MYIFLLSWVTEAMKPKPFYLIELSLGEFVISIIVSQLKFAQSLFLHSTQPVLHHPCIYCKTVRSYFVYVCVQLCLVWSVVFILWYRACSIWISDSIFWFITSFESLNHHSFIMSQVSVCYPVDILSESGYNLRVFHFSKVKILFGVSSLTKVTLIKVYKVCCIILCPVSSPPADN